MKALLQKKKDHVIYGVTDRSKEPWWKKLDDFLIDHSWVQKKEKSLFFNSLKLLVLSGIRIPRALLLLAERTKNPRLERILRTVHYDLTTRGLPLSTAMGKYPSVFTGYETKMILSAEVTGKIEDVLGSITTQIQKNIKLQTQVRSAMIYPITVFGAIFLAIIVIMNFVVPQFESLFANFGSDLPLSTRILINGSHFFQKYWWLVFSVIIAGILFFQNWKTSPEGKIKWDAFVFSLPGLNKIIRNFQTIQIAGNFSTLLSSGVPVIKSLQILRQIIGNEVTKEALFSVETSIRKGKMVHESFRENPIFDPILGEVIEIGEQSGAIQEMLQKTAEQYEMEFDADMQNLSKLVEPVVLIIVAAAIVFMGMAIMTPIMQLQELFTAQ